MTEKLHWSVLYVAVLYQWCAIWSCILPKPEKEDDKEDQAEECKRESCLKEMLKQTDKIFNTAYNTFYVLSNLMLCWRLLSEH